MTGREYKIHCPDSGTLSSSDWLLDELARFRKTSEQ